MLVIAEAGVNHDGDLGRALELVEIAAAAGADAVKFQTFRADRLTTVDAPKAAYQKATTGGGESQQTMLARLELDRPAHEALLERCQARGIVFLSSPFDLESADLLEELGVVAYKLGSGEVTHPALIRRVAATGKPLVLSTGMATEAEIAAAVDCFRQAGGNDLALLHCVSCYPTRPEQANLHAIARLRDAFGVPVGWSDHTLGTEVALAAVALGACVIEKHFTHDKTAAGPDHRASLEPDELTALVASIRAVERALGDGVKAPHPEEAEVRAVARRSLASARAIAAGTVLAADDLIALRPASGICPTREAEVIGRRVTRDLAAGVLLTLEDLA